MPKIKETISTLNTDIICLQEAHLPSFQQDIGDYFDQHGNYDTILNDSRNKKNKPNKKGFVMTMTTPILFKRDKFKLISTDFRTKATVALLQFIDPENKQDIDIKKTNNDQIENESQPKNKKKKNKKPKLILDNNQQFIWICNVHLEGDPAKPDVRFNQIKKILNSITNKTKESKLDINKVHVIFTGDFNAGKGEVIDTLLLNGYLKWDYRQSGYPEIEIVKSKNKMHYKHEFKFKSAYDNIQDKQKREEILTFYARDSFHCIDHVYYTANNSKCIACMETVPQWLAQNDKLQCPNHKLVSDHLPIASLFEINDGTESEVVINEIKHQNTSKIQRGMLVLLLSIIIGIYFQYFS